MAALGVFEVTRRIKQASNVQPLFHSILGETIVLIALIGIILAIVGVIRRKAAEEPMQIFAIVHAGCWTCRSRFTDDLF